MYSEMVMWECLVQGLWRGTVPGQLLTIPYTAVQFVALQQCRTFAKRHGLLTGDWAFMLSFVSGAVAGSAATVASYPFDVLRTVLAAQGRPPVQPLSQQMRPLASILALVAMAAFYAWQRTCLLMSSRPERM